MGIFDKKKKQEESSGSGYNDEPAPSSSVFDRVGGAEPSEGGIYPDPGVYPVLWINALKMITSRKGDDLFIAEFDILESNVESRKAGTSMSWVCNFKHDPTPGHVRAFMAAAAGCNPDEVGADEAKLMCSKDNPCHGRLLNCKATNVVTRSGNDFTRCSFEALGEDVQERAKELREQAGFAPF